MHSQIDANGCTRGLCGALSAAGVLAGASTLAGWAHAALTDLAPLAAFSLLGLFWARLNIHLGVPSRGRASAALAPANWSWTTTSTFAPS